MQNSILFPLMVKTGGYIIKIDPIDSVETIKQKQDELQEKIDDAVEEHITHDERSNSHIHHGGYKRMVTKAKRLSTRCMERFKR